MEKLINEIRTLIIESLNLEDISPEDIDPEAALFGDGLGLDSIDALELGLALKKKYKISISPESENVKSVFFSVKTIAEYIANSEK